MLVLVFRTMPEVLFMKTCCMLTDIWSKILFEILFEKYVRPFSALLKNLAQVFMFYFCFFGPPPLGGKGHMKLPLSVSQ